MLIFKLECQSCEAKLLIQVVDKGDDFEDDEEVSPGGLYCPVCSSFEPIERMGNDG